MRARFRRLLSIFLKTHSLRYPGVVVLGTVLAFVTSTHAQDVALDFAVGMGGPGGYAHGEGIVADERGNVYITGYFGGVVNFDPGDGRFYLASQGDDDIFVCKIDSDGEFVWAKSMGGKFGDRGINITLGQSGCLYVTGFFQDTVDFDPGVPTAMRSSRGGKDYFVSKLNFNGELVWIRSFGGLWDDCGNGIAVDHLGNAYIGGSFEGSVDFDPGAATTRVHSAGNSDSFVQKLDSDGELAWIRTLGGAGRDSCADIALDSIGNAYVAGKFAGTAISNTETDRVRVSSVGPNDIYVQKLDTEGSSVWVRAMGGEGEVDINGIAVDHSGNVHTTGSFQGTVDLAPGPSRLIYHSTGTVDAFVSKLDTNGVFLWAKTMGGEERAFNEGAGWDIKVDAVGHVYIAGVFLGSMNFGAEEDGTYIHSVGPKDSFIQELSPDGNFISVRIVGGLYSEARVRAISLNGSATVFTTGSFLGYPDFDPTEEESEFSSRETVAAFVSDLGNEGRFTWARALRGRVDTATGRSITTDASGNVYSTGEFTGTNDFDPGVGTTILSAAAGHDTYVQKLDPSGTHSWTRSIGSAGSVTSRDIAADGAGNTYIIGNFYGTADFDPGMDTTNRTSVGSSDVFILKLDPEGFLLWVNTFGAEDFDRGNGLALDQTGNVYVIGEFSGTIEINSGSALNRISSTGRNDVFVQKLNSLGKILWTKIIGGNLSTFGSDIAIDPLGNLSTTGSFSGSVDFDPDGGSEILTSEGNTDLFVQKLDSDGRFLWVRALSDGEGYLGKNCKVTADAFGNVYMTGYFDGTVDFDPGEETYLFSSAGDSDVFVQKLDTHGKFTWARSLGGASDEFYGDIAVDVVGNVYVTGSFRGFPRFNPGDGSVVLIGAGASDIFLQKLSPQGKLEWAKSLGGRESDWGSGIVLDALGSIYLTGRFEETVEFDPTNPRTILNAEGGNDAFVLKFRQIDAVEGEGEASSLENIARDLIDTFPDVDLDLDGLLSLAEARATVPTLSTEQFAALDGDSDGFLSRNELEEQTTPPGCFAPDSDGSSVLILALLAYFLAWWERMTRASLGITRWVGSGSDAESGR